MAVDKHGLKMVGLKQTSGCMTETDSDSKYYEVFYDTASGKVWALYHYSIGRSEWTEYEDKHILRIIFTSEHMTMQELADEIHAAVKFRDLMSRVKEEMGWEF